MGRILNVYHVTSYECAVKILDGKGIDPALSQGARRVVWLVGKTLVPWAIAHVANRHGLTMDKIAILLCKVDGERLLRTSKKSVYCTTSVLKPVEMDSASIWLQRQEKAVVISKKARFSNGWRGRPNKDETDLSELQ